MKSGELYQSWQAGLHRGRFIHTKKKLKKQVKVKSSSNVMKVKTVHWVHLRGGKVGRVGSALDRLCCSKKRMMTEAPPLGFRVGPFSVSDFHKIEASLRSRIHGFGLYMRAGVSPEGRAPRSARWPPPPPSG